MAMIRATCPACGEIDLTADDIQLIIRADDHEDTYHFECPSCVSVIDKPADDRVVRLLLAGGVRATVLPTAPDGDPFTYDDLLDFHFELLDDSRVWESLSKDDQIA